MPFDLDTAKRNIIDAAQRLAIKHQVETLGLAGKRIRVLRALTFEGDAEAVLRQLAQSLPVGTREWGKPTAGAPRPLSLTVAQGEIEIIEPATVPPPRVHVADLDPDTLVGIAPCDDGDEGWVVLQCVEEVDPSDMVVIKPVGDEHGQIVYVDINDAAEVLRTGHVWKHDMGDGEPDAQAEADGPDTTPAGQDG